jgi:hypothetical protein
MSLATIFRNYGAAIGKDQHRVEALRRILARFTFDGTECHRIIDSELRGLENELTASAIKHKIQSQFHDCIPIDAVLMALLETGELP